MARSHKVGTTATTVKINGNNGSVTYHYTINMASGRLETMSGRQR